MSEAEGWFVGALFIIALLYMVLYFTARGKSCKQEIKIEDLKSELLQLRRTALTDRLAYNQYESDRAVYKHWYLQAYERYTKAHSQLTKVTTALKSLTDQHEILVKSVNFWYNKWLEEKSK